MSNFIEELKARRSQYALTSESPVSDQEIVKTVEDVTVQVPSAFNSQPQRAVVLFGDANQKLWNIVKETLRKVVSDDEAFKATEANQRLRRRPRHRAVLRRHRRDQAAAEELPDLRCELPRIRP